MRGKDREVVNRALEARACGSTQSSAAWHQLSTTHHIEQACRERLLVGKTTIGRTMTDGGVRKPEPSPMTRYARRVCRRGVSIAVGSCSFIGSPRREVPSYERTPNGGRVF